MPIETVSPDLVRRSFARPDGFSLDFYMVGMETPPAELSAVKVTGSVATADLAHFLLRAQAGDYYLRVRGSTAEAIGISEGSVVLMRPAVRPRSGDICEVWIPGAGGGLRRVFFDDSINDWTVRPVFAPLRDRDIDHEYSKSRAVQSAIEPSEERDDGYPAWKIHVRSVMVAWLLPCSLEC
jgi:hypothetical protein